MRPGTFKPSLEGQFKDILATMQGPFPPLEMLAFDSPNPSNNFFLRFSMQRENVTIRSSRTMKIHTFALHSRFSVLLTRETLILRRRKRESQTDEEKKFLSFSTFFHPFPKDGIR